MFEAPAVILVTMRKQLLGKLTLSILKKETIFDFNICSCIFSISNYPNYESHMPPPARFLDTTGEKKSTTSSPRIRSTAKLQREAFQINV